MNAIVVAVDRLHVGYLGCFGNAWVATPEFNQLAVDSFAFDQAIIDTPRLGEAYDSFWSGSHRLQRSGGPIDEGASLAASLARKGVSTTLISDNPNVSDHRLATGFGQRLELRRAIGKGVKAAADIEQTHLARSFAQAAEWLASARQPFFLWLHTEGLGATWDAPLELRNEYAETGESPPPVTADVPCGWLDDDFDPDLRFGHCQVYAGQVSLLDACLGGLLMALSENTLAADTLLAVVSIRGMPLGEHRRIGGFDDALYNELVHVPWLFRLPDGSEASLRSQALVQPSDLCATLCDWWRAEPPCAWGAGKSLIPLMRDEVQTVHDRVCIAAPGGEQAIRTPGWHMRLPPADPDGGGAERAELFVKPDDFWELNDVANRCQTVVEALRGGLDGFRIAAENQTLETLAPLDDCLLK